MHILIVDDDEQLPRALQRALKDAGYTADRGHRISCAGDGNACRRIVAEDGPVDVMFMDGDLGIGDTGPQVVSMLREAGCTATIIMTSGSAEMCQAGIEAGANGSCNKPILGVDPTKVLITFGIPPP